MVVIVQVFASRWVRIMRPRTLSQDHTGFRHWMQELLEVERIDVKAIDAGKANFTDQPSNECSCTAFRVDQSTDSFAVPGVTSFLPADHASGCILRLAASADGLRPRRRLFCVLVSSRPFVHTPEIFEDSSGKPLAEEMFRSLVELTAR